MARHGTRSTRRGEWFRSVEFSLDAPLCVASFRRDVRDLSILPECLEAAVIVDGLMYFLMRTPAHYSASWPARAAWHHHAREIELGGLLLPHLRRAVTISNVLDVRTIERARMAEALDALRCGVVLADGRARSCTPTARPRTCCARAGRCGRRGGVLQARRRRRRGSCARRSGLAAEDEAGIGKQGLAIRLTATGGGRRSSRTYCR